MAPPARLHAMSTLPLTNTTRRAEAEEEHNACHLTAGSFLFVVHVKLLLGLSLIATTAALKMVIIPVRLIAGGIVTVRTFHHGL